MRSSNNRNLERGSVESALSLIPTTAFFLLIIQLMLSGSWQLLDKIDISNAVNRSALFSKEPGEPTLYALDSKRGIVQKVLALPGGGEIITYSSTLDIPLITSLSGQAIKMKSEGIAIRE
ncbi:MAG: hypothetical protein EB009_02495 [Actinobacteria bacterium]|nr:hypothetical protein [Actinomycetota bacterium]NBO06906.1 hypothetical protein [Actinomycetota bacterium]NBO47305.1 hypothetical protein [Actinomycetota bacterium]NBP11872.1 hypothetical protein [Actinomycetota bacterium]NBQ00674.1 hypothetical protein [Actinomycetota bacterium]